MAYVDLNPVRANIAGSISNSDYTSGQSRLREITAGPSTTQPSSSPKLLPFVGNAERNSPDHLPFNLQDYLDLLDDTGRATVMGKHGSISAMAPRLLAQLGIQANEWFSTVTALHHRFELAVGAPNRLKQFALRWGKHWVKGMTSARRLYPAPPG